jgi:cytochrome c oxidase subunit II
MRSRKVGIAGLLAASAGLAACARAPSYMRASGSPGDVEARLGWWLTGTASAVVLIVSLVLLAGLFVNRGRSSDAEPKGGLNWIYVGLAATVLILIASFVGTMVTLAHASRLPSHPAVTLDVTGHQWWWEVHYGDSIPSEAFVAANEIHIPVGRPVLLRVQSADVIHSFWIPELAGKVDVIPGQTNEMWLQAQRPGRYHGQCAEYCGLQHAKMALSVVAEPPAQFAAWAAGQRQPARDSAPTEGAKVFAQSCGGCHAVRGSEALGRYGPDLTHVASRATLAAGVLPNTRGNLAGWIANAQAIKPGSRMPALSLPPDDLLAVVAYLQHLR